MTAPQISGIDAIPVYRGAISDLLATVLATDGRSDYERDALARVGIQAAGLVEAIDDLERSRLR